MRKRVESGNQYNKLTFIARDIENSRYGWFICECGDVKVIRIDHVLGNKTKSCGCYHDSADYHKTHGMSHTKEYNTWTHMKQRCYNDDADKWGTYKGSGIKVCDRWLESFENFYEDMGPAPTPEHSIHRIDNDGDYTPENCVWETKDVQALDKWLGVVIGVNKNKNEQRVYNSKRYLN